MRVIYTYILVTVRPIQTTDLCFRAPLSFGLFLVNGRRAAGTDEIYPTNISKRRKTIVLPHNIDQRVTKKEKKRNVRKSFPCSHPSRKRNNNV